MKKLALLLCLLLCAGCLFGCTKTYTGDEGLLAFAREELALLDVLDLKIDGKAVLGKEALVWFSAYDKDGKFAESAMSFKLSGEDKYAFIQAFDPLPAGKDMALVTEWQESVCFCINNTACRILRLEIDGKVTDIPVTATPFVYVSETVPTTYAFLDADGNPV